MARLVEVLTLRSSSRRPEEVDLPVVGNVLDDVTCVAKNVSRRILMESCGSSQTFGSILSSAKSGAKRDPIANLREPDEGRPHT